MIRAKLAHRQPGHLPQLTAAVGRTAIGDPDRIRTYLRDTESACNCWQESPYVTSLPNVAVSGWVLFALAELDLPATESEVRFFLTEQNKPHGWWSVFQARDDEANASTFGTAWALLGLQNQRRKKLIPNVLVDDTSNAIRKGFSWLSRQENRTRWKDFPSHPKGAISLSLSGLAMHALSLTAPELPGGTQEGMVGASAVQSSASRRKKQQLCLGHTSRAHTRRTHGE